MPRHKVTFVAGKAGCGGSNIANVTAADGPEVVTSDIDGGVVVAHGNGTVAWRVGLNETLESGRSVYGSPLVEDFDGDGRPEVLAATRTGTVTALDAKSGAEVAVYERNVPVWTFVTPADIDTDGSDEILVRYGDGRVVALEYTAGLW